MTIEDFTVELIQDWQWRADELRLLRNTIAMHGDEEPRSILRRSMVLVLYAHFEGFAVFALNHYVTTINREEICCQDAASAILAASWEKLFVAMESGDEKCKIFQRILPNDQNLHRHWRRRHFVEEIERFLRMTVRLPDDLVDAESNLKPWTLKRNLFLLGLDHKFVDEHVDHINRLLRRRNDIAHGDERRGVQNEEYVEYEAMVLRVKDRLIELLIDAIRNGSFARPLPYVI